MFRFPTFVLLGCLLIAAISCRSRTTNTVEIDLTERLIYAETSSDVQEITFGTKDTQKHDFSGWGDPEKDREGPFQWAVSRNASFTFSAQRRRPLYLHVKMKSFFENPAEVFVNSQKIARIVVDSHRSEYTIPMPANTVVVPSNTVEFRFAEFRSPEGGADTRKLAAAAYQAWITPSRHFREPPKGEFLVVDRVRTGTKRVPAIVLRTGGTIDFYERLNRSSVLRFGFLYRPSPNADGEHSASFSVLLEKDGKPERNLFQKQVARRSTEFVRLPLASWIPENRASIYRIRFQIARDSTDREQTAWLQPVLEMDAPERQQSPDIQDRGAVLRNANKKANVVVILLDAARADHFGCYGYGRNTTPIVDKFAKESILFRRAYTDAVYTLASTASLMTGLYPEHHRILYMKNKLPSGTRTLARVFSENGYETATFVANGNASGAFGMTQGFDEVAEVFRDENYTGWGQDVTNRFSGWLDRIAGNKFFAYLHYREPHDPFNPPEEWVQKFVDPRYKGKIGTSFEKRIRINTNAADLTPEDRNRIRDLYDANLAYGDFQVGQVLDRLRKTGQYDNTIVIVTADHGEAIYEHGFQGHNSQLYEECARIPLIMKLTRGSSERKTVDSLVRTIDLYPTLVDLFGFSRKEISVDGRSSLPYLSSGPSDGRDVITQTTLQHAYSYREEDYKYIIDHVYGGQELYNLDQDPGELHNLIPAEPFRAKYYRSRLMAYTETYRQAALRRRIEKAVIDETARQNLEALGYLNK